MVSRLISRLNWFGGEIDINRMETRTKNDYNPKIRMPGL
jgi:hypothetical protein